MKMRYTVTIEYYHFVFDTPEDAIAFATTAKMHTAGRRYHDEEEVSVSINVDTVKETEKAEDEEE